MAFTFRLERVLSVRRLQEEAAQQRHARARERCLAAEAAVADLSAEMHAALEALDALKRCDELTADALYLHSLHASGLRRRLHVARTELARCAAEVERAATELVEAHRAVEALEKLRERDEATWRKERARKEADAIDEIAVSRHRAREEENHGP
ncbi:MAG: flagellar export protein FliJ [Deltaproteobacteria bacterium]|nr:flagellar export protein FliJ [Deltaproteobacteria bacterium]